VSVFGAALGSAGLPVDCRVVEVEDAGSQLQQH
jgi:hypothetical protein